MLPHGDVKFLLPAAAAITFANLSLLVLFRNVDLCGCSVRHRNSIDYFS